MSNAFDINPTRPFNRAPFADLAGGFSAKFRKSGFPDAGTYGGNRAALYLNTRERVSHAGTGQDRRRDNRPILF